MADEYSQHYHSEWLSTCADHFWCAESYCPVQLYLHFIVVLNIELGKFYHHWVLHNGKTLSENLTQLDGDSQVT